MNPAGENILNQLTIVPLLLFSLIDKWFVKSIFSGCQETNSNAVSGAGAAHGENGAPAFKKAAPESIADSEDSLSISLPSEGPSNPFSEVRAGILKIFDEASVDQANKVNNQSAFNIEEPEDFPSFDNVIFDEKHEFEKTEKMISSSASTSAVQSQTATSKFAKNPIMSKVRGRSRLFVQVGHETKGQLSSKCPCGVFKSPPKQRFFKGFLP